MSQVERDSIRVVLVPVLTAKNDLVSDAEPVLVSGTVVKSEAGDRRLEKKCRRGPQRESEWRSEDDAEERSAIEMHEIHNPLGQCQFLSVATGEQ